MKRLILIIIAAVLLLSCSENIPMGRTIVISIASDYSNEKMLKSLSNPPNDQAVFIEEVRKLAGGNPEIYMFRVDNMKSYISRDPVFQMSLESTLLRNVSGDSWVSRRIPFHPEKGDTVEREWSLTDVAQLLSKLETDENDLLIIHYSGHGLIDGSITTAITNDNKALSLSPDTLLELLSDRHIKGTKVMFIDSCYSGEFVFDTVLSSGYAMTESLTGGQRSDLFVVNSLFVSLSGAFRIAFAENYIGNESTYVISASSKNQMSYDYYDEGLPYQRNFGAFTYYLVRAMGFDFERLSAGKRFASVTLYTLYNALWNELPVGFRTQQTPRVTLSPLDVVLF